MVVAYLKVGTAKEHLEEQRNDIAQFTNDRGLTVDKWITDVIGKKTRKNERNLDMIVVRMQRGDILVISDISRLGRTLSDVMSILAACMEKGIHLYCIKDRYILDEQLDNVAMAHVFNMVADIEHNLMSTRTREALAQKKKKGGPLGRPKGSDAKQAYLDANKEEVISMLEQGESVLDICRRFNVSRNTYYLFRKNYGL
ncbi:recombinase family protein [Parabacteroides sp. AM08-6]|uniref:recombinase family protein n=1 Tax=Parabacteroides sp. AM08-6 TaxID=2292053 RepID=UPI000EFE918A|nr:recombinase family protein [Parabacteroides sp. AM08-6]RHJ83441.1 hypothetical protein DW103_06850 [Parabacteroides sp. AM08-6]